MSIQTNAQEPNYDHMMTRHPQPAVSKEAGIHFNPEAAKISPHKLKKAAKLRERIDALRRELRNILQLEEDGAR